MGSVKKASMRKSTKTTTNTGVPPGPAGTNAALATPIVGDAAVQPGFSFTPELDRLFAAGYPHIVLLHPTPVPDELFGAAFVDVVGKAPYAVEWPANLARPLVRLLPVRGVGALVPGTTTLTERGHEIFADTSDVSDDELEALLRAALGRFFYPSALREALLLQEAVVGERAVLVFARALDGLTREQLHRKPELAELLASVPTMLLRTSRAVHDETIGLLRALFARHADSPHQPVFTEARAIDVLDSAQAIDGDESEVAVRICVVRTSDLGPVQCTAGEITGEDERQRDPPSMACSRRRAACARRSSPDPSHHRPVPLRRRPHRRRQRPRRQRRLRRRPPRRCVPPTASAGRRC
jgi:hypothetical protein